MIRISLYVYAYCPSIISLGSAYTVHAFSGVKREFRDAIRVSCETKISSV